MLFEEVNYAICDYIHIPVLQNIKKGIIKTIIKILKNVYKKAIIKKTKSENKKRTYELGVQKLKKRSTKNYCSAIQKHN